jgi:hypothetical protein
MRADAWMKAGFDFWTLAFEAGTVMALRTAMIAAGGAAAEAEIQRMFSEKVAAGLALQALALRGGLGSTGPEMITRTARHYRHRVRRNRKRLTKAGV